MAVEYQTNNVGNRKPCKQNNISQGADDRLRSKTLLNGFAFVFFSIY